MHSKSFTFGIGTGMIIVSLLFYMVYSLDIKQPQSVNENPAVMKDEDVITRAKRLGMVFINDLQAAPAVTERLTDDEIIARAEILGMVFNDSDEDTNDNAGDSISADIIPTPEPAADVSAIANPAETTGDNNEPEPEKLPEPTETPAPSIPQENPAAPPVTTPAAESVVVYIPPGSYATDVIDILYNAGVIDNVKAFNDCLMENNATRRLGNGTFTIPLGADNQDIINILMRKRQGPN